MDNSGKKPDGTPQGRSHKRLIYRRRLVYHSILIRFLVFFGLIGLSAAIMRPVHNTIYAEMNRIRSDFIVKVEDLTGFKLKYSSIRPTIFGSFDIRNLRLVKDKDQFLSIPRARINFSFLNILKGKTTAIYSIQLDRAAVVLDLEKDKALIDTILSLNKNNNDASQSFGQIAEFFSGNPDFRIRDFLISITGGDTNYLIRDLNIDITADNTDGTDGPEIFLAGKFNTEIKKENIFNRTYAVKTTVEVNGTFSVNLEEGRADIDFSNITGSEIEENKVNVSFFKSISNMFSGKNKDFSGIDQNEKVVFEINPLKFGFVFSGRTVNLNALSGGEQYNAFFNYNTDTGDLFTSLNCTQFNPAGIIAFQNVNRDINRLFSMTVNGSATYQSDNSGSMQYNINFNGLNLANKADYFVLRTHGSEKLFVFDEFKLYSSPVAGSDNILFHGKMELAGRVGFSPLIPAGIITFDKFSLGTNNTFNGIFNVSTQKEEIRIAGNNVTMGHAALENMNIYLQPSGKELSITLSSYCDKSGAIELFTNYNYRPKQMEVSLALNNLSIASIPEMASPFVKNMSIPGFIYPFAGNSVIDAEIFFTTDFNQFVYNAPNIVFKAGNVTGVLSVSGTDKKFTLSDSTISRDGRDLVISSNVNFANPMDLGFTFNANYQNLSWKIEGQVLDRTTLTARDPNGLHAYGSISDKGAVSGYLEGIDFPVPAIDKTVYLNFYGSLRYTSKDFWIFNLAHLRAHDYTTEAGRNIFSVSGLADQDGAGFRDILFNDDAGFLAGGLNFSWDPDFSYVQFLLNMTDGRAAGENYSVDGMFRKNELRSKASLSNMRLDRFIKGKGAMVLNGNADIVWDSVNSFSANLNITSMNAKYKNVPVEAQAAVLLTEKEFNINNLKIDYSGLKTEVSRLVLNIEQGKTNADANINGFVSDRRLEGNIVIDAEFNNIDSWAQIKNTLDSLNGTVLAKNIHYGNKESEPVIFEFFTDRGAFTVLAGVLRQEGRQNMLQAEMDNKGNFFASLSSPLPVRSTVAGVYKEGLLDAHCNDFYMDLSALWELLPPAPGFGITGGYITGRLDIRGPLVNPNFYGQARGTSIRMLVPDFISQEIKPVPFNAVLEGNELSFESVQMAVGNGRGTVDGWLRFENWVPKNTGLDIKIPRNTPVPYAFNLSGFQAKGDASGSLLFVLENNAMEVTGELYANNAELGVSIDDTMVRPGELNVNQNIPAIINLTVTTGSAVEFIWPNVNMPILRANPELGTVVTVFADSQLGQYTVNSDVVIRSGELYYFDRNFYIRRGNLVFRESEQQFNPRISARAEIRDRTDSGPVTISMVIDNEPLLSFVPRFEANPSLTQLEIYTLLGHNVYAFGGGEDAETTQRFLINSGTDLLTQLVVNSEFFNQFIAVRQFERTVRNVLNLDVFSVRTRFLQNAVATNVSALGQNQGQNANQNQNPVDRNTRVGNYFDNTTVFVGKYVGQDMFIQGVLSMRYDENQQNITGLKFEPDIGIELQSPLFNIRWDFFPYSPENWWVNDNSITLMWSRSF
uniref:Translocation/assembly module TamB n=1 Tax=uncultured bacterium contig00024 TaxID=1181513 RepID=A0A806JYJ2_9BACT|nr:putative protein BB0794 [uncultured bacterium contig00024]